jgi:hypothetical protein
MSLWSIDDVWVRVMGSPWIIFFSIARLFVPYGVLFSVALGCPRLCLVKWLTCLLVGGLVVALTVLLCGKLFLFAYCGVFGGK